MNKLKHNLKHLLDNAKISENELARRSGVSQQIINRILSGENTNPKLATLSPLASYFLISISELIGDEIIEARTQVNTVHLGWQKIPLLELELLQKFEISYLLLQENKHILIDIQTENAFALKMVGDAMEPKFSDGTLLIFESLKKPQHRDFCLLKSSDHQIKVRQVYRTEEKFFSKSLNPASADYHLCQLDEGTKFLGVLIQSRTQHGQL